MTDRNADARHSARRCFLALVLLIAFATRVCGYPAEYGPFDQGEMPRKVPLRRCPVIADRYLSGDKKGYPSIVFLAESRTGGSPVVRLRVVDEPDLGGWEITVLDRHGAALSLPTVNEMTTCLYTVYSADLNRDKRPDFLVNIMSGGGGLAGCGSVVTFLVSRETRYEPHSYYTFDFSPEDLIRLKKGGPCYFIHSGLIHSGDEKTRDGRDHNFWVYQLLRFEKADMAQADADDPRFPKWVWYTFKDNHRETALLTAEQKKRLFKQARPPRKQLTTPTAATQPASPAN